MRSSCSISTFDARLARLFGMEPGTGRSLQLRVTALAPPLAPVPGLPHIRVRFRPHEQAFAALERLIGQFPELLREARGLAKWVILDTPPLGEVSDGLRFAPECDGIVLVARARHTDRSRLILAYNQLAHVGARLLGMVINDQRRAATFGKQSRDYHGVAWEVDEAPDFRSRWAPADSRTSAQASSAD